MSQLLLIDDDVELCEMLSDYLDSQGLAIEIVHDPTDGVTQALSGKHALVILDVMLPGMNGFEVLRRIRAQSQVPVLMLSARGEEIDRIIGLEVGADDYLPKPFNPRELVARIQAVLRRSVESPRPLSGAAEPESLCVGDLRMDVTGRQVQLGGNEIELTAVEFEILKLLLGSAGKTVSRKEIFRAALGRRPTSFDRSVDVHISSLRRKLGHRQGETERISTIRGVGYLYARPGNSP